MQIPAELQSSPNRFRVLLYLCHVALLARRPNTHTFVARMNVEVQMKNLLAASSFVELEKRYTVGIESFLRCIGHFVHGFHASRQLLWRRIEHVATG